MAKVGEKPDVGYYRCPHCDFTVEVKSLGDEIPICPDCFDTDAEFVKVDVYGNKTAK